MKIQLADGLPYHPTKRHPHTGEALRALLIRQSGEPVWPVMGASEDDGESDGSEGEGEEGEKKDSDEDGSEKSDKDERDARIAELEAEISRVKKHRSEADKKKSAAEKELQELKNKDLPDVERLKKELEEARQEGTASRSALNALALTNSFLVASQKQSVNWHDPEVAQAALDREGVEVDKDGKVTGMAEAVKKLAKAKPFLVKQVKSEEDDKKKEEDRKGPSGSGVGSGNGGGKGQPSSPTPEELRKRFPALGK